MTARGPARRLVWAVMLCSLVVKLAGVAYMQRYLAWNLVAPDTRDQYRPLAISLVEGRGYLGLEEMVVITESGCDFLTDRQRTLPLLS